MTHKAAGTTTNNSGDKDQFSLGALALDFLDTTWRIATPVALFAIVGIVLDNSHKTAPWCTLVGVVIGFTLAGYLVKRQLQASERHEAARAAAIITENKEKGKS